MQFYYAMEKRAIFKDSIKKLISLGVSDAEIVSSMRDVGLERREARELIAEAREELKGAKALQEEPLPADETGRGISAIPESEPLPEAEEEPSFLPPMPEKQPTPAEPAPSVEITKLWEEGILATVDAKLEEMEGLKDEIDKVIEAKVRAGLKGEIKKMQTVIHSQQILMLEKINSELERKGAGIVDIVNSKLDELKKTSERVDKSIARFEKQKDLNEGMLKSVDEKIAALDKVKSRLISELNASLIKSKSGIEDFIAESAKKRDEMQVRINRAIDLESKIREGLIQDAKQKIDRMALAKSDELTGEINRRIREIDALKQKIDPDAIKAKLAELDALKKELGRKEGDLNLAVENLRVESARLASKQAADARKELEAEMKSALDAQKLVWKKAIDSAINDFEELLKELDIDRLVATMGDFEIFKKQFVAMIKKNVEDFNQTKKEMADAMKARDEAFSRSISRIDEKMRELDEFEGNFAKEMGIGLDRLTEKEKKSSAKKKGKKPAGKKEG